MGSKYGECLQRHGYLDGQVDGCQEFMESRDSVSMSMDCQICGCNRNFHRKIIKYKKVVVYTKCHKIERYQKMEDGCQEFVPSGPEGTDCAACGCHKSFHRNEITGEETSSDGV